MSFPVRKLQRRAVLPAARWTRKSGFVSAGLKDLARVEKGISDMLITQEAKSGRSRQGSLVAGLSQLREQLACPENLTEDSRQRLLELDRRQKRQEALGNEHFRASFSEAAVSALESVGAVT